MEDTLLNEWCSKRGKGWCKKVVKQHSKVECYSSFYNHLVSIWEEKTDKELENYLQGAMWAFTEIDIKASIELETLYKMVLFNQTNKRKQQ